MPDDRATAIQQILRMGNARLLRESQSVRAFGTDALHRLVRDLLDTMRAADGVGLAAPRIGVDLQVMIFGSGAVNPRYPQAPPVPPTVLCNPVITPLSDAEEEGWEGCLSVSGLRAVVPRWRCIRCSGFDPQGAPMKREAEGFHARVVQHKCEHSIGKLYPMRVRDFTRFGFTGVLAPGLDTGDE